MAFNGLARRRVRGAKVPGKALETMIADLHGLAFALEAFDNYKPGTFFDAEMLREVAAGRAGRASRPGTGQSTPTNRWRTSYESIPGEHPQAGRDLHLLAYVTEADGRRRQVSQGGFRTRREAEEARIEFMLVGSGNEDLDLAFCHPDGRPYEPNRFSREFIRKQEQHNRAHPDQPLPRLVLHGLRHT